MSKVKLLSNLQTESGVVAEGMVIDLPDAQAEHLVALGAAEVSDDAVTATPAVSAPQEVEPAADPLVEQTAGPSEAVIPVAEAPAPAPVPAQPVTPETPASSSTNLHLG